jgi:DNA-directed RNA polymerase subunit K/omega
MIHPSYSELMNVINSGVEEGEQPLVQSRYSIVKAAATRAKQIIDSRAIEEKLLKMPEKDKDKVSEPVLSDDEEFRLKLGEPTIPKSHEAFIYRRRRTLRRQGKDCKQRKRHQ